MKRTTIIIGAIAALGTTAANADNSYPFDDPYWKRPDIVHVGARGPVAAGHGDAARKVPTTSSTTTTRDAVSRLPPVRGRRPRSALEQPSWIRISSASPRSPCLAAPRSSSPPCRAPRTAKLLRAPIGTRFPPTPSAAPTSSATARAERPSRGVPALRRAVACTHNRCEPQAGVRQPPRLRRRRLSIQGLPSHGSLPEEGACRSIPYRVPHRRRSARRGAARRSPSAKPSGSG